MSRALKSNLASGAKSVAPTVGTASTSRRETSPITLLDVVVTIFPLSLVIKPLLIVGIPDVMKDADARMHYWFWVLFVVWF
jgi:hypothetical protein